MIEAMLLTATKDVDMSSSIPKAGRTSAVSHLPALKPAELSFLLGLLAGIRGAEVPAFPPDGDAALLWEYIERHGMGGILGGCADRVNHLPSVLAKAARHRYWSNCLHGQQARQRCNTLIEASERAKVTVFFVKGPALVDQGYGDDGLRGFADLDLFTGSANEARRLAAACGAQIRIDSSRRSIWSEIGDSGRVVAELDGTSVEIRFPVTGWTGPLFDLFPSGRLPTLEWTANGLPAPNAEWHFLFLLHHLMMHHLFGRFIWFLDLAVLVRHERAKLNWGRILEESERLTMREGLATAANFCRSYVDPDFPEVPPPTHTAWNRAFIHHLANPQVILSSRRNKQQIQPIRRVWAVLHGAASYFLLTDIPPGGHPWTGRGRQWTEARVRCVLASRWRGKWGNWLGRRFAALVPWFIYPLARLLAWMPTRRKTL